MAKTATRRRRQPAATTKPGNGSTKAPASAVVPAQGTDPEGTAPLAYPGADPVLADAADRAADIRDLAADDVARILADGEARATKLLDSARTEAASITEAATAEQSRLLAAARHDADQVRAGAATTATTAAADADRVLADAEAKAEQMLADARRQAEEVATTAAAKAEQDRTEAATDLSDAETRAAGLVDQAREQGRGLLAAARTEAASARRNTAADLAAARDQAATAITDAETRATALVDQAREQAVAVLDRARTDAERTGRDARDQADALRQDTADDARRTRDAARRDAARAAADAAERIAVNAREAKEIKERATEQARKAAEAQRAAESLMARAREEMAKATSRQVRRLAKAETRQRTREVNRQARQAAREDKYAHRAKQREGRPTFAERGRKFLAANGQRIMVAGPILAPMAVAWSSQADYAMDAFSWPLLAALGFAAAWELTTVFSGWMYHQARRAGDPGLIYRIATWVFAGGAAAMNYAHHCGPSGAPTQPAVSFAAMSIVGMILWELYASLLHRRAARAAGRVAQARPSIGIIRWTRFPRRAWTAWSLTINDQSLTTLTRAWEAAGSHLAEVHRVRDAAGLGRVRRAVATAIGVAGWLPVRALPPVPNSILVLPVDGSPNPVAVPNLTVNLTRLPGANPNLNHGGANLNPDAGSLVREPANRAALEAANLNREPVREPVRGQVTPPAGRGSRTVRPDGDGEPANRRRGSREDQVQQVMNLIGELGYDAVTLPVVMERTGMGKTTAHHRLKEARELVGEPQQA